ncbi:MAG TPA: outer membrane protein assembly factor BamA [Candidatus Methylomirabilis sp.]|nr:outer membrane protein assembly factor BamA [Candidatus Methylomirabilis sp.]
MNSAALWILCALLVGGPAVAGAAEIPTITGVEIEGAPATPLLREAIGDLVGRPLARAAIRHSLARLWSLGQFDQAWAEEIPAAGWIMVRFHLVQHPTIRHIAWQGETGLDIAEVVGAANLSLGGDAGPARLATARQAILDLYRREGYFQARVEVQATAVADSKDRDVTVHLQAGKRARIGPIVLRGSSQPEVEKRLKLHPGDDFNERSVRQRLRALEDDLRKDAYYTARLTLAGFTWNPDTNRVVLDIDATLGPKVAVSFSGVAALKEAALLEKLSFADAGTVDEIEVDTSARQIEAAYRDAGYAFARVTGELRQQEAAPDVHFDVSEGPEVTVEVIGFSGNQAFSAKRLRQEMQTHPHGLLQKGIFRQETLDGDLLILTAFYRTHGYTEAVVGPGDVRFSEDRRHARIEIPIREGPRLTLRAVVVNGAFALPPAEILRALPFKSGDAWSDGREAETRRSLMRLYAQHGYLGMRLALQTSRQDERVNLEIRLREGEQTRVGRILLSGLIKTGEDVVLRELTLQPGDPFDPDQLVETERRLSELGVFDSVQVGPLQPPPAPFVNVQIVTREGKPWRLEFGGGYSFSTATGVENNYSGFSTGPGWEGFVQLGYDNLFGRGHSATAREMYTEHGDRTDLSYGIPHLLGSRLKSDVTLYRFHWDQLGYKQDGAGLSTGVARYLLPEPFTNRYQLTLALRYDLEWVNRYAIDTSLIDLGAAGVVPGAQVVGKITPSVSLDHRDNPFDPKRGSFHSASLSLAGPYLGSQASFVKSSVQTAWFFDWIPLTTVAAALRLGAAWPYGASNALPNQERFYAGGSTTIRGYAQDKVGPLDSGHNPLGGNALVIGNLEFRFPIWRWLSGVGFVDSGTVAAEVDTLRASEFRTGVGGGLRIRTPIGPIRFDAGYGLNSVAGSSRWQFYFAIGQAF